MNRRHRYFLARAGFHRKETREGVDPASCPSSRVPRGVSTYIQTSNKPPAKSRSQSKGGQQTLRVAGFLSPDH